jgi:hypothetical protein
MLRFRLRLPKVVLALAAIRRKLCDSRILTPVRDLLQYLPC